MVMLPGFVDGPPAQAQRGGLVANSSPGDRQVDWLKGVQWWPEDAGGYQLAAECTTAVVDYGDVGVPRPVVAQPFLVRTNVQGPKSTRHDLGARAARRLEFVTGKAIAREFWLGELAQAAPFTLPTDYDWSNPSPAAGEYTTPYLAMPDPATVPGGALDPATAMAAVEEQLGDVATGGQLYLHMPLSLITVLGPVLTRQGDLLLTDAGSAVICDRGYTGDGAAAGTWIYGTGPVMTWVGDPTVYNDPAECVRVSDNHIEVWADRPAMTLFDPQTLVAAQVGL